jgi:hypothetical protein
MSNPPSLPNGRLPRAHQLTMDGPAPRPQRAVAAARMAGDTSTHAT